MHDKRILGYLTSVKHFRKKIPLIGIKTKDHSFDNNWLWNVVFHTVKRSSLSFENSTSTFKFSIVSNWFFALRKRYVYEKDLIRKFHKCATKEYNTKGRQWRLFLSYFIETEYFRLQPRVIRYSIVYVRKTISLTSCSHTYLETTAVTWNKWTHVFPTEKWNHSNEVYTPRGLKSNNKSKKTVATINTGNT